MVDSSEHQKAMDFRNGISGLITAPIGYVVLLFLPVYLEVSAQSFGLDERQVGLLAATDSTGLALATLLFALFVKRLDFHLMVIAGVVITVTGNLLSIGLNDFSLLCGVRIITGFGEGLLVAVGVSAVGMTSNPNRWFGFYTAAVVVVQAIGLLLVPLMYEYGSMQGVFASMACLYLVPLLVLKRLPRSSPSVDVSVGSKGKQAVGLLLLALIGMLSFYICIGGVWAYVSFMGTGKGLTLEYVSQALAISMIAGFGGALFFAALGAQGRRQSVLLTSILMMMGCLWWLNGFQTGGIYLVILCIFCFFWSVVGARLFAVISDNDHSGKFISAAQTIVGLGFVIGPMIASMLVDDSGFVGVNNLGIVTLLLCFVAVTPLAMKKINSEDMPLCVVARPSE